MMVVSQEEETQMGIRGCWHGQNLGGRVLKRTLTQKKRLQNLGDDSSYSRLPLWWLILCVKLSRSEYPDICSNTSVDITEKIFLGETKWRVDSLEKTLMLGGIGAGGEEDDRGWDGWMASLTRWTWVWVNSGSWWWTGRPGVPRFMRSQIVRHNWATELNWTLKAIDFKKSR